MDKNRGMNVLAYVAGSLDGYDGTPLEGVFDVMESVEAAYRTGVVAGQRYRVVVDRYEAEVKAR